MSSLVLSATPQEIPRKFMQVLIVMIFGVTTGICWLVAMMYLTQGRIFPIQQGLLVSCHITVGEKHLSQELNSTIYKHKANFAQF